MTTFVLALGILQSQEPESVLIGAHRRSSAVNRVFFIFVIPSWTEYGQQAVGVRGTRENRRHRHARGAARPQRAPHVAARRWLGT